MDEAKRAQLEAELTARCDARDWEAAATAMVSGYGPELLGLLVAIHRDENDAAEVFSQTCENLWKGLPQFERRSSFRTWAYAITHNASNRYLRDEGVRRRRQRPLGDNPSLFDVELKVRTQTFKFLRSQVRTRFDAIRESLPAEDQMILILRFDKELDWTDLARVLAEEDLDDDALKRESARLRKRFQLLKERLRAQAEKEGLLGPD